MDERFRLKDFANVLEKVTIHGNQMSEVEGRRIEVKENRKYEKDACRRTVREDDRDGVPSNRSEPFQVATVDRVAIWPSSRIKEKELRQAFQFVNSSETNGIKKGIETVRKNNAVEASKQNPVEWECCRMSAKTAATGIISLRGARAYNPSLSYTGWKETRATH
uniref:Uncharacterized protein n=1 Tax=Vespula pensylvanica TaxID=30213 RepID=A0A834NRR9_VESPE|nr:hypothetical protein H0235_011296 [Vespula pensylvanica]